MLYPTTPQSNPWGFPSLLTVTVWNATKSRVLPSILFVLLDSSSLWGRVEAVIGQDLPHQQLAARFAAPLVFSSASRALRAISARSNPAASAGP